MSDNVSSRESSTLPTSTDMSRASTTSRSVEESPSRSEKPTFMEKRREYRVVVDNVDVTPDPVVDPEFVVMDEYFTHAAFDHRPRHRSEVGLKKSAVGDAGMKVYATTINLDDIHIDHTLNTEEGVLSGELNLEVAPSAFYLPKETPIMSYPPSIFVVLKETQTQLLFELPSISCDKGSAEANIVEQENEFYTYITVGKGRNRKTVTEETQTQACTTQTRHTLATRPQKKNATVFASVWDMHDTYAKIAGQKKEEEPDEMVMYQSAGAHLLRRRRSGETARQDERRQFTELARSPAFQDAALLTERVLAAIEFSSQQKRFRGLMPTDPLSLDLIYIYTMKPLWTFDCGDTSGRPITCIDFNPKNQNILAVGHGKFGYAEPHRGMVCIWCTKNPCKPERTYPFDEPLTSVSFSTRKPNWLACGFSNGDVIILDITSYEVRTIARSKRDTNPCFEPIWSINWRLTESKDTEYVMTTCQDGRINRFTSTKTNDFICTPMMRVTSVEGKTKGLEVTKNCVKVDVPITRYPAALCMKWHPIIDHVYYVGTDEGCIHKCSTHYLNQHMDVFRAHAGPVYKMELSPFMKTLLVSCGADNCVRLWIDGIDDVIMTLSCPAAVYDVAFCPVNATVLITVSGNMMSIWDLRRKTHMPCTEYSFPGQVVLTYVKFSSSGDNVYVGDTTGRVHTFHLEDTPIPPYFQRQLLDEAIKKALCTRPRLLQQLEKLALFQERFGS